MNHLSYFRSRFWGSETSYLFWVSTLVTSCGQPEGIECCLPGTSQGGLSLCGGRCAGPPEASCALYLSFEGVHHLDKHQSPFYCCLARFLVTVRGSTFVSLTDTLAAARAETRSKCCPQRSADISKCKPSKAVVMLTWRGCWGVGEGEGGAGTECIFDLQRKSQLFRFLRNCCTCQKVVAQTVIISL